MMRFWWFRRNLQWSYVSRELQLLDQLGVRFLDFCNLIGRSQNRVLVKIFCASGTVSEVMRFTYKRNEVGSQKGPEVVISSENVTPSRLLLKSVTDGQRRNGDSALGPATAHTPHTLQTLMANKRNISFSLPVRAPFGYPLSPTNARGGSTVRGANTP